MPPPLEARSHQCPDNTSKPRSLRDRFIRLTRLYGCFLDEVVPVPAGCLVVERSRRQGRGPARHQTARRHRDRIAAPKSARALDGFGCPTEAPYGCFLPDLTRFGTCRHPNPSNALGARYILPAPARWGKVANLGRGLFDWGHQGGESSQESPVPNRLIRCCTTKRAYLLRFGRMGRP